VDQPVELEVLGERAAAGASRVCAERSGSVAAGAAAELERSVQVLRMCPSIAGGAFDEHLVDPT
jgi:hypothetical protein